MGWALAFLAGIAAPTHAQLQSFRHAPHEAISCLQCHQSTPEHGTLTSVARDCLACHHAPERAARCASCHDAASLAPYEEQVVFTIVGQQATHPLSFDHGNHVGVECTTCHTEPRTLAVADGTCNTCHAGHHAPDANCAACHAAPAPGVHTRTGHVSCSTAGCHAAQPFEGAERQRTLCLGCHRNRVNHEPDRRCADCHLLPPWGGLEPSPFPEQPG